MTALAWHYTIRNCAHSILASGVILPATAYIEPHEKPVVWFSVNQYWEQTANKMRVEPTGEIRRLDMRETYKLGEGLFRFGIDADALLAGEALRRTARINPKIWHGLTSTGRRQGANPDEWRGVTEAVLTDDLTVERMNDLYEWERVR